MNPESPDIKNPVFQSDRYKNDKFSLVAKINDLAEHAYLEIMEEATGKVFIIPEKIVRTIRSADNVLRETHIAKTKMQQSYRHPLNFFSNLYSLKNDGEGNASVIMVIGTSLSDLGAPMLTWQNELQISIINIGKKDTGRHNGSSGWKLTLNGFKEEVLGFAKWNDLEALTSLVSQLNNKRGLTITLSLSAADKATQLTAGLALREYVKEGLVPEMETKSIRKSLINAGYRNGGDGQVAPLIVEVDGEKSVIAVGVSKQIEGFTANEGENRETHTEIESTLSSSLPSLRRVDLESLLPNKGRLTYKRGYTTTIWFTAIPEEKWNNFISGIPSVAKIDRSRSWF